MNNAVITMKKRHVRLCSRLTRNDETAIAAPALAAASKRRWEIDPDWRSSWSCFLPWISYC
jgi:hypothetical protein